VLARSLFAKAVAFCGSSTAAAKGINNWMRTVRYDPDERYGSVR
jgi:hypothetical protein